MPVRNSASAPSCRSDAIFLLPYAVAAAQADERVLAAVAIHPEHRARAGAGRNLDEAGNPGPPGQLPTVCALSVRPAWTTSAPARAREAQHYSFREHIRLAKKHNLALQIHDRDAHEDVIAHPDEEGAPGADRVPLLFGWPGACGDLQ